MRRLPVRRAAVAAVLGLLLVGCGDQTDAPPGPADPTRPEVTPTTEDTADATGTTSREDAAPEVEAVTSVPGVTTAGPAAPPEPTSAVTTTTAPTDGPPTGAAPGECSSQALSQDLLGFTDGVSVSFCEDGWAYAEYHGADGSPGRDFIAELADDGWHHAVFLADPVCADELTSRGAPPSVSTLLPACDPTPSTDPTPEPTSEPTTGPTTGPVDPTTPPPASTCTVPTEQYGPTRAELVGVSCEDATAEWQVAEANAHPSWTVPILTPSGWECYVTPHDPTSAAAGSCYGPDGSSSFTLYVP